MRLPSTTELFDLSHTRASELLLSIEQAYLALPLLKEFIEELSRKLPTEEYKEISEGVFAARDAEISEKATVMAPTVIGHKTVVRPGAFIRGGALIGDGAVIGNSTEIKNAVIFDGAQLPHYNYVGDSIIGYKAHLGAGAIISNFRLDRKSVRIRNGGESLDTTLRKLGAMVADGAEVGCNSVIFPGTYVCRGAMIYPLCSVRGIIPENTILRADGSIKNKESR